MIKVIDGTQLLLCLESAAAALSNSRQAINDLNVFPVPDGDTGTNMSLTLSAGVAELQKKPSQHAGQALDCVAGGLLRGARGNSGVILSLLFRGMSRYLRDISQIGARELAVAFAEGVDAAYKAVMKPAEGTMLSVARYAAANVAGFFTDDAETMLAEIIDSCEASLADTVNQNPVLKKAGVIDAGGKGVCVMLSAMLSALRGEPVLPSEKPAEQPAATFSGFSDEDITFTYCTEFIVARDNKERDPVRLRVLLQEMGDSLVLVDDDEIIKVHVHCDHPGKALEAALAYGQLMTVKIENMRCQHTEMVTKEAKAKTPVEPSKKYGFVAVSAGDGISNVFKELGADQIVEGGQTMNPSTKNILELIEATPAETVFVLPNNKNIILAAEQCDGLSGRNVVVVPTKSIPQGITAMLYFNPENTVDENKAAMLEALSSVSTGYVTYAARDSDFDGHKIDSGDHMALLDGSLLAAHPDRREALRALTRRFSEKNAEFITIYYGEGISQDEAGETAALFRDECPGAEVSLVNGGQPVYYYIISAE